MAASNLLEARQMGDGKAGKQRHHGNQERAGSSRLESGQERQGRRRKLSWPTPFGVETRELTTSFLSERKARDDNQWRRRPAGPPTIGGWVWEGAKLPPSEREEEEALWAASLEARPEN